jgi:hypothetical protein
VITLFLGVEGKSVSGELADSKAYLIIHVEPGLVLVRLRSWFIVDGSKSIECTSDLEDVGHLVLEKFLGLTVVREAMCTKIVEHLLNAAVVIKHKVDIVHEPNDLNDARKVEVLEFPVNVVEVTHGVLSETFLLELKIIILVKASYKSLDGSADTLNLLVHLPHQLLPLDLFWCLGITVSEDPFVLLIVVVVPIWSLLRIINIWAR